MAERVIGHRALDVRLRPWGEVHRAQLQWPVRWAFYAFIFSLPFQVLTLPALTIGVSIQRALGAILLVSAIMDPGLRPWRIPKTLVWFVLFAAIYVFASFRSEALEANMLRAFRLIQLLILLTISYNLFLRRELTRRALLVFVLSCACVAALTLAGIAVSPERIARTKGRLSALGMDENVYAFTLVLGIVACIGITHSRKDVRAIPRLVAWPILVLLFVAAARTGSRGAAVALVVGLVTLLLKYGMLWTKVRNVVLVALVTLVGFWLFSRTDIFVERVDQALQKGLSNSSRVVIARESWKMITEKPIMGWGPYRSMELLAVRLGDWMPVRSTHNTFLALLLDVGIIGALPFCLGVFACCLSAWRGRKGVEDVLPFAICAATLAIQLSLAYFWSIVYWFFLAYPLASGHRAGRGVVSIPRRRLAPVRGSRS